MNVKRRVSYESSYYYYQSYVWKRRTSFRKSTANKLGIHFYDHELIRLASKENDIPYEELLKVDEKKANQWRLPINEQMQMQPQYHFHPMNDVLFETESKIIERLGKTEDCIIVGRCANYILGDDCLSLFVYAPYEYRVKAVMERLGREEKSARALVKKMDKTRKSYYEFFTDQKWNNLDNYQLCVDTSRFSQDFLVDMLAEVYKTL